MHIRRSSALVLAAIMCCDVASAAQLTLGELDISVNTRISTGLTFRTQARNSGLIAKIANDNSLCAEDDCISFDGDPEPNQRLVNATGLFSGANLDDGNINYDKGDITAATTLISPEIELYWKGLTVNIKGHLVYDPVNTSFVETHLDTRWQPRESQRPARYQTELGRRGDLRELNLQRYFDFLGREWLIKAGSQVIPWGESNLILFNSVNEINPLDGITAGFPGFELADVLVPVDALVLGTNVTDLLSVDLIYQYGWEPVRAQSPGSFLSTNDVIRGGETFLIALGQYSEDPEGVYEASGSASLISQSHRTGQVLQEPMGFPEDGGQYGLRLSYYAENLNYGTELKFYYLNYHARYPALSVFAADRSCTRDGEPGNFLSAAQACNGFNGTMNPSGMGEEPLPIDSLQVLIEYPEDIRLFGASFNTNVGEWALSGEFAYRPNLPLQIHITDIVFAGLQPALPEEDIQIGAGDLGGLLPPGSTITVPGARSAVPDYLSGYRGIAINAGDYVQGFERFKVSQASLTGLRILSTNPFAANQLLFLAEAGVTHIQDLPGLQELPLHGAGDFTHTSPGADGTGGEPDTRRLNPTQQVTGLPTEWAWGYRLLARLTYNEIFSGITLEPTIFWFHDVEGNSAAPLFNFVERRKQLVVDTKLKIGQALTLGTTMQWFMGGGAHHTERDRDNMTVYGIYEF